MPFWRRRRYPAAGLPADGDFVSGGSLQGRPRSTGSRGPFRGLPQAARMGEGWGSAGNTFYRWVSQCGAALGLGRPANPRRTRKSRAAAASSAMNTRTNRGFGHWLLCAAAYCAGAFCALGSPVGATGRSLPTAASSASGHVEVCQREHRKEPRHILRPA